MTHTSWKLLARHGTLVTYAIIAAASGTGSQMTPFLKVIGRSLLWSVLPNGRRATFYNVWSGHSLRRARFRRRLQDDLTTVFGLVAEGAIAPNIAARFPLEQAAAALALAESRTLNGKVSSCHESERCWPSIWRAVWVLSERQDVPRPRVCRCRPGSWVADFTSLSR